MIPVIMKGETSKPIQLALKEGYEYSGCALHVNFCGLRDTFVDLAASGSVELRYTAEQTARLPLGTSKVMLSIENARNEICFMPWAKIKVTDCPEDVRDAQITIDPATLNVEDLTTKDTLASVKSRMNAVMAFLRRLSSLVVLALPIYALSDVAPLTAPLDDIPGDTPIMTNVVPYVDAKVAAVPAPDYSTNNAQLRETIAAVSPPADLTEATNHTRAALSAFASTGTVERARSYGTPTRWTDASGDVWEIGYSDWTIVYNDPDMEYYGVRVVASGQGEGAYWIPYVGDSPAGVAKGNADSTEIVWFNAAITDFRATRTLLGTTNFVGRVALTNDIPDVSGYATPADVTAAIREKSLGGIWDQELGVWWTPIMQNGALRYVAATNVNLSTEGNP
ncbi:MAG: hypothetical protein IJL17_12895 [Kiritimatiellae bacterium]|nr:hypothetical protein [Kiritimatiellia bacterium]